MKRWDFDDRTVGWVFGVFAGLFFNLISEFDNLFIIGILSLINGVLFYGLVLLFTNHTHKKKQRTKKLGRM